MVADQTATLEVRRQQQQIRISVWCPDPHSRDAVANLIDGAIAGLLGPNGNPIVFIPLPDGTAAGILYVRSYIDDAPSRDAVWRRDFCYAIEYPTVITQTQPAVLFGQLTLNASPVLTGLPPTPPAAPPLVGAIRFDGSWGASSVAGSVAQQMAAQLSPAAYNLRAPFFASIAGGMVSWPAQTQATMDAEITAAVQAGLGFWAFDSYRPTDPETVALTLYLSSTLRGQIKFCMVGQLTNWNLDDGPPYAAGAARDVLMFTQAGYVTVLGGRPLYFLLDAAGTPAQQTAAITWLRAQAAAQGSPNPYVVWLSAANVAEYDNTAVAQAAGADAAGSNASPELNGSAQNYEQLVAAAESDWFARRTRAMPMIPTAMAGWDQRPAVATPEPYYQIPSGVTITNYYEPGTPPAIAAHVANMLDFIEANPAQVPANVGLIYAWNEVVEGGWIMPTWQPGNPSGDLSRALALQLVLNPPS